MSHKYALIIGNGTYDDPQLPPLKTPARDVEALEQVLRDPQIGAFDEVVALKDERSGTVKQAVDELFNGKKPDDLVLFYFSGHGVLDNRNRLYLATQNTRLKHRLRSTSLEATYLKDWMEDCRSQRQVMILDSCYSGAFIRGSKSVLRPVGTAALFEGNGYGRYVLTASDELQLAYEGDQIIEGQIVNSVFTHFLVEGLQTGAADRNRDGYIDIDELYDYIYEQMARVTSQHDPRKFTYNEKGDLRLAYSVVLSVVAESEPFNVYAAISDYHRLFDKGEWAVALTLLERIQQSGQAPSRFDIAAEMAQVTTLLAQRTDAPPPNKRQEQKSPVVKKPQILRAEDLLPTPFTWVKIPGGQVTLIEEYNEKSYLPKGEAKMFKIEPFAIAKYPLTNAQFAPFIEAGGYKEKKWWTEAGWQVRGENQWTEPRYWTDDKWNGKKQPVVGVSWYEAVAYCLWVSDKTGQKIMLPTEEQWQYAAQGDDGRAYPWGNDWDCKRCNNSVKPCDSNSTTPVTAYEGKGNSPFGVVDLAGNVWEWCLTEYESGSNDLDGTNARVLRGGSWYSKDTDFFRVLARNRNTPSNRVSLRGFRLALSL